MISQPERWQRICQHPVGGDQHALFISKLMKEQRWDKPQAEQAVREYQRFVYLACRSPAPVSPSHAIDAVWHLHLSFSRDYWQCFCPEVLGRELHHEPADSTAGLHMQQQYQATLALYAREFGAPAPAAIWGGQPATGTMQATWSRLIALTALLGTSAAIAADDEASLDTNLLIALGVLILLIVIIWRLFSPRRIKHHKGDGSSGSSCGSSCSSGASCGSSCGGGGD